MNIRIELQDQEARGTLRRLTNIGTDLSPITSTIAAHLKRITEDAFKEEKDPATDEPWANLSGVTLEKRKKSGHVNRAGRAKKLQVTRHLLDSIVADHDSNSAVVGTNLKYAATHQFGALKGQYGFFAFDTRAGAFEVPWGDIPARPFLGISTSDQKDIEGLVIRHLNKIIYRKS